jgi:hypothetical protein
VTSDPNESERKTNAVAGLSPLRVQISQSAFRELTNDGDAVMGVGGTLTEAASVCTSMGRIQAAAGPSHCHPPANL